MRCRPGLDSWASTMAAPAASRPSATAHQPAGTWSAGNRPTGSSSTASTHAWHIPAPNGPSSRQVVGGTRSQPKQPATSR